MISFTIVPGAETIEGKWHDAYRRPQGKMPAIEKAEFLPDDVEHETFAVQALE
jgi:hypothetical protein